MALIDRFRIKPTAAMFGSGLVALTVIKSYLPMSSHAHAFLSGLTTLLGILLPLYSSKSKAGQE